MDYTTIVSKVLRNLLPIYAIRVSTIQEIRCDPKNEITFDVLAGRFTTFELDNFDNYLPGSHNIKSAFKEKLTLENNLIVKKKKNLLVYKIKKKEMKCQKKTWILEKMKKRIKKKDYPDGIQRHLQGEFRRIILRSRSLEMQLMES